MSATWGEYADKTRGHYIRVGFSPGDCDVCPSKARCTKTEGRGRQLTLHPREEHEALAVARARLEDEAGRKLYAQRQGVESAIAQAACALGLRRARYCGLAKTHLQNVATAAATDIDRLGAWFAGRPLAPHASRALPRLPRSERLRQQCPAVCRTAPHRPDNARSDQLGRRAAASGSDVGGGESRHAP